MSLITPFLRHVCPGVENPKPVVQRTFARSRPWSGLRGDRELDAAAVVDLSVEDLVVERGRRRLLEEDLGARLLEHWSPGWGSEVGMTWSAGESGASWLIRSPPTAGSCWSTSVFTTVLAFSVRVSTGASPSLIASLEPPTMQGEADPFNPARRPHSTEPRLACPKLTKATESRDEGCPNSGIRRRAGGIHRQASAILRACRVHPGP